MYNKNPLTKIRKKYISTIIQNDIRFDNIIQFNNILNCEFIDKNIYEIINDETAQEKEDRLRYLFPNTTNNNDNDNDYLYLNMKNTFYMYIPPFYEYHWFKKVISLSEDLPICITISSAKKELFGFPLLYVNKHFETTTGYSRNEVIGKNCKFLQPSIPIQEEETQYVLLSSALRLGVSTSVIITNVKKNGTLFYNLISLKPVIDEYQNYLYCIGIQMEVKRQPNNTEDIKNIIDIINILSKIKIK
uniref:PAS domain-containing protein n=1 Tax=viral metagenome TaxID=1070528 RepID=A0A6C0D403_9ZZZZ